MPHALIIDDTPSNMTIMAKLLANANFTTTTISDLAMLADAIESLPAIDIVFTDLNLDGFTGYDVLHQLRDWGIAAPIVACSVYTDEIIRAREMGFNAFIGYPLKINQFVSQVQRVLAGDTVWEK
jgi:two-component system copper resistance phosphate regulon response regulator CusR